MAEEEPLTAVLNAWGLSSSLHRWTVISHSNTTQQNTQTTQVVPDVTYRRPF